MIKSSENVIHNSLCCGVVVVHLFGAANKINVAIQILTISLESLFGSCRTVPTSFPFVSISIPLVWIGLLGWSSVVVVGTHFLSCCS